MSFIKDLTDGSHVIGHYFWKDKQQLMTKTGKDYLKLQLEDKTGSINAMVWDLGPQVGSFDKGDIIKVDAKASMYNDALQLTVSRLRRSNPGEYQVSDFFRTSKESTENIYQRLLMLYGSIEDPGLKKLVGVFCVDDPDMVARLKTHPAAKNIHHGYIGGLLEHMVSVTTIALSLKQQYTDLDRDLLIAGGLLHDIGKLVELEPLPMGDYSDPGRFIGHISIGYRMVHEQGMLIKELDPHKLMLLEHMILSHHGEREFGSPVVPITKEAMALHLADYSDSKMKQVEEAIETDLTEGDWTTFNRPLERYFYKSGTKNEG